MIGLLEEKREDLVGLCERYRVRRLEVFGSAAHGEFDPRSSDLDFLVEYQDLEPVQHADAYFDLLAELEDLFQLQIDLVEIGAVRNPYFKKTVEKDRTLVYEG